MTVETIITLVLGALGGGVVKTIADKGIDWLRFRGKDKADASKTIHDSQAQIVTVSSSLLAQWIKDASIAEQNLIEARKHLGYKDIELREALHAVNLCKESLKRCQQGRC